MFGFFRKVGIVVIEFVSVDVSFLVFGGVVWLDVFVVSFLFFFTV